MKNFDNLEIGKYYVSAGYPSDPVRIVPISPDGNFIGGNGRLYLKDGTCWTGQDNDYLITEVTVTVTPVEPKKPHECWVLWSDIGAVSAYSCESDARLNSESGDAVVHMREVMEGEE